MNIKGKEEIDLEWGGKLVFINSVVGGAIDLRFMPAILKGVMERMEQGPLTGSYARDVRVIVYDGKMHPVDSNELSFMLAARNAFSAAFKEAGPKVLEPHHEGDGARDGRKRDGQGACRAGHPQIESTCEQGIQARPLRGIERKSAGVGAVWP